MISFDVFGLSPQGYEVHFQLQGEKVYDDAVKLLEKLEKDGFGVRGKASSNGQARSEAHYCQEHQTEYKRFEKDGRVWYSHKTADGKWCKEK